MSRGQTVAWYGVAAVTYIAASLWQKSLLNWLIGPAWLVVVVAGGPVVLGRIRGGRADR